MIIVDSTSVYLDYILSDSMRAVVISCFDRSQQMIRSFAAQLNLRQGRGTIKVLKENGASITKAIESHYEVYIEPVEVGKEKAYHALLVSSGIGENAFFTSSGNEGRDFYRYLMKTYTWPLLEKWGEPLYKDAINWEDCRIIDRSIEVEYGRYLSASQNREVFGIPIHQMKIIRAVTYSESNLIKSIQTLFQKKKICISKNLQKDFRKIKMDDYFKTYGHTIVANLEKTIQPLIPIKGSVDNILLDKVRLYPQQAAVVNGVVELLQRSKYAFLAEGMGTGKTLQSMSVCESFAVREYMKKNPTKTLKEIYSDPECIRYRNIVMCPGHLVYKWADEIKKRIPFSEVTVLTKFSQLIDLRKKGPKRKYREYYIMSMDFAKLTYSQRPVPTKVRHGGRLKQKRCIECGTEYMKDFECPRCHSKHFRWIENSEQLSVQSGLVCPNCDQYLLKREEGYYRTMMPPDFASQNVSNSNCYYCGTSLWEPNVRNLTLTFGSNSQKRQWYKITHYANAAKNSVKTAWVLDGYEHPYLASVNKSVLKTYRDADGVRKYSPATFIKKYMRGFFDFAIFDEVHKFKGGTTGQGNAMDSLVKASRHQLALTGTIAGGKADHLFYLLFRLDPVRMVKAGFSWTSVMKFAEQYGSIEIE